MVKGLPLRGRWNALVVLCVVCCQGGQVDALGECTGTEGLLLLGAAASCWSGAEGVLLQGGPAGGTSGGVAGDVDDAALHVPLTCADVLTSHC